MARARPPSGSCARPEYGIAYNSARKSQRPSLMQYLHDSLIATWQQFQWICVIYCVGLALEWLRPAQTPQPLAHIGFNIGYTALFLLATNLLVPPLQALT